VGGEWKYCKLVEDAEDNEVLLTEQETIDILHYIPHTHVALVFLIEYHVGVPYNKDVVLDVHKTLETTLKDGHLVTPVSVGAAAYLPYTNTGTLILRNINKAEGDTKTLDVELSVQKEELCGVLSPNPVFRWVNSKKESKELGRTGSAAAAAAEEDSIVMGFDLHAFSPAKAKIEHGYELTSRDQEAIKDSAYEEEVVAASADDKESDDAEGSEDLSRPPKKGIAPSKTPRDTARDDDEESLPDSIVGGDSVSSVLRLDRQFYTSERSVSGDIEREGQLMFIRSSAARDEPLIPKDRNSLLARSLMAKLAPSVKPLPSASLQQAAHVLSVVSAPRGLPVEDDGPAPSRPGGMQRAPISRASGTSWPVFSEPGKATHVRELSRASRARLGRYGFLSSQLDSVADRKSAFVVQSSNKPGVGKDVVDIELEACDPLALSEVTIQFAGYRHGSHSVDSDFVHKWQYSPKAVYFTFQFFTCAPTRTEVHRLLPADRGEMNVLCRDDPHSRDEQPLALRFEIDCSATSPLEGIEFAEYLARGTLQVDVWDADSLLLLGSTRLPLRRLLRQGQRNAFCALECDVVDVDCDNSSAAGGVATFTLADDGGPPSGAIVGSVNIIAENCGREGAHPTSAYFRSKNVQKDKSSGRRGAGNEAIEDDGDRRRLELNPVDGLNWRALGVGSGARPSNRPRHLVRARPLSESTPELSKALNEVQRAAGVGVGPSMRSLSSVRGSTGAHTLTYDDIMLLFKRFQGGVKGTVQYEGNLLNLLDVPSWSMSIRKLMDAFGKSVTSGDNIEAVRLHLLILVWHLTVVVLVRRY
jgi:hypothetical protein